MVAAYLCVVERYAYPNGELSCAEEAAEQFDGLMALVAL
jgi:hypothetical protein